MKQWKRWPLLGAACLILTTVGSGAAGAAIRPETQQAISAPGGREAGTDSGRGTYGSADAMLRVMKSVASDGDLRLYVRAETADIAVQDTASGKTWFSSPYDFGLDTKASEETRAALASFISLVYYDSQGNELKMNGYTDCTAKNQFTCETIEDGVRIRMQIGKVQDRLAPFAAEASRFEEKVIGKLSGSAKRRVLAFYTRYSAQDAALDPDTKRRLLSLYPGLADYDLYIMREDATERDIALLNDYIQQSSYTPEDFNDDLLKSGYDKQAAATALFDISVEFTLKDGGLVVNVPADQISYDKENFVLNKIRLMEFFGAGKSSGDGYLFVPDGSGSLIRFNSDATKKIISTVNPVYGRDASLLQNNANQNLSEQACLPVFGIKEGDKAFLGVIEDGDAMAQIVSESGNIISSYETVAVDFVYAVVQSYLYNDGMKQNGLWTYMDKNYYQGDYRIRYSFLTGEKATYVGMAQQYRAYLIANGTLKKLPAGGAVPLYLEAVGMITRKSSLLGIPYDKDIDITSFSDAVTMMNDLKGGGVSSINLRFKGWMNGGLNNAAPSKLSIEKKLGGADGFKTLAAYTKENGFGFFPDVNFHIVRHNGFFDDFSPLFDSPRSNDDNIVSITPPEEIHNVSEKQNTYYPVKASKASTYYTKYFNAYERYGIGSTSISYAGNLLYSDFKKGAGQTRQSALDTQRRNLEEHASQIGSLLVDGGNAYILPYARDILNMPLTDSAYTIEDESVPFMQIVLHGYVQYAGAAVNLSDNWKMDLLRSAEYGANLYFSLGYKHTEALKDTTLSHFYSIDYATWRDDILRLYAKYNEVFAALQDQAIIQHERVAQDVYKTTYENGTAVVVNYSNQSITENGVTVGPQDFSVI